LKVTNKHFSSLGEFQQTLELPILDAKKTLIQIFTGLVTRYDIEQIINIIKEKNKDVIFIGTTTAGEIYNGEIGQNSIAISIMEFTDTSISYGHFINNNNDYELGLNVANTLFSNTSKAMILFIDGLLTNGNDVIDGISEVNHSIPIAGGMAGDNGAFKETLIFNNDGFYNKGVVAVTLNSTKLNVFTDYHLNWKAIGEFLTITKVEKNRLYEINNMPASEIYRKYLGDNVGDNLPFSATEFPLLKIEEDGQYICRTFIDKFDDGSLLTIGNLEVGDKVKLAFGNIDSILSNVKNTFNQYYKFNPEAIYTYSCTARKNFLQAKITAELKPISQIAPMTGFFTYGEIFHNNNKNSLLNVSLTILGLSEGLPTEQFKMEPKITVELTQEKNFLKDKHFLVLDALTHLSNTVIEELNNSKKELEDVHQKLIDQANRDYLTNLYNRRYFNYIAHDFISLSKREQKQFCVIMLDIDKFKGINDSFGHSIGDDVIKRLASLLIEHTRDSDIVARYGGEEFALLLPFTEKEGAYEVAQKLRQVVEQQKIVIDDKQEIIQFTISLGVTCIDSDHDKDISDALKRADIALYNAKKEGRNKVVVI
jgi:diguanylate cyclase (GGDEF)-like protein